MARQFIAALVFMIFLWTAGTVMADDSPQPGEFLVLAYHAVTAKPSPDDEFSVSRDLFAEQMEYLRTHGYHPISIEDILKAGRGEKALPDKAVLLTFDDAYVSYYEFVVPFLEMLGYPSVLGVVGSFVDDPPKGLSDSVMSWKQIKEVSGKKLVEVVSHSYDLHKGIQYNPAGNVGSAAALRAYNPKEKAYETEAEYRARIAEDFETQKALFIKHLGSVPKAIIWPYGWYTLISQKVAADSGCIAGFTTEAGFASTRRIADINRIFVKNKPIGDFISLIKTPKPERPQMRAVQVDLDLIYDPSYEKMDQNLGKLIDRLVAMKMNTVFLQAFADPEGSGTIRSVYFDNRVLPVRADFFSHAAHQMIIRNMTVYAWMPTLSIELPDRELNESLRVREGPEMASVPSRSWYNRLTPFDSKVRELVAVLYQDLASHSLVHGVLFQDDAYLTDKEDFHPAALSGLERVLGRGYKLDSLEPEQARKWMRHKTENLIEFTKNLMESVRIFRPNALFARNIYASLIMEPESEAWFAQNYGRFIESYDSVVVMAYPQMEKVEKLSKWLERITKKAREFPHGIEKTVFKLQSYDWEKKSWIKDKDLLEELRDVLASGGKHIAYYPDNFWEDKPGLSTIKLEMSTESFPFMKGR